MNTHSLQLATIPFNAITSGHKVIESRLYDEKRQSIQPTKLKHAHAHVGEILHVSRQATLDEIRSDVSDVLQRSVDEAFAQQKPIIQ